jgi:ABC-2 type transport system ATP-binding protein
LLAPRYDAGLADYGNRVLSVAALEKTYRPSKLSLRPLPVVHVLRGVDLYVRSGEVLGILGANGAGKTTLLAAVAGLTSPDRGVITLDDHPLEARAARCLIGICTSADRSFYYRLTMRENLVFFGRLYGLGGAFLNARVDTLLQLLSLQDVASRRYVECSTGMRQRLALARALLHDPPVLLLDEPTRGLDPLRAHEFRSLVRDTLAHVQRKIVMLATNILEEAWSVCDRVALLADGRIVAIGPPEVVRERMTREFSVYAPETSL